VRGPEADPDARFSLRAVKTLADGALGSRGAAMLAPYEDDPGNVGLLLHAPEEIEEICRRAMEAGFQPCVHAIGDRANRMILDLLERLGAEGHPRGLRPRIEHAQILAPSDIPRFARLGVIASVQPIHCTADMPWAESRVGAQRIRGAYAWRSLVDTGARLAAGSDFPIESADPLLGIYAAVTRREAAPTGRTWQPEERLSFDEALAAYTRGGVGGVRGTEAGEARARLRRGLRGVRRRGARRPGDAPHGARPGDLCGRKERRFLAARDADIRAAPAGGAGAAVGLRPFARRPRFRSRPAGRRAARSLTRCRSGRSRAAAPSAGCPKPPPGSAPPTHRSA
jgi:hypothetical protein